MVTPAKNTVCLWFNGGAEEAARFYAATFPGKNWGQTTIFNARQFTLTYENVGTSLYPHPIQTLG